MRDCLSWLPFQLACTYTIDSMIIQLLLKMDACIDNSRIRDTEGFMEIHHACANKNPRTKVIKLLLETETHFFSHIRCMASPNGIGFNNFE